MNVKSLKRPLNREAIITSNSELLTLIGDWAMNNRSQPPIGQSVGLAQSQAAELRRAVCQDEPLGLDLHNPADAADIIHAACRSLDDESINSPRTALAAASKLWNVLQGLRWNEDEFGEKEALLCSLAFVAWRSARMLQLPSVAYLWEQNYLRDFRDSLYWDVTALACGTDDSSPSPDLTLEPESLFQTLLYLHEHRENAPRMVAINAEAIYESMVASGDAFPEVFDPL